MTMDEKDVFAVWFADAMLQANDDPFGAASLNQMTEESATSAEFDAKLDEAASQEKRPGDFGIEFLGPLLPVQGARGSHDQRDQVAVPEEGRRPRREPRDRSPDHPPPRSASDRSSPKAQPLRA